jgi:hypothetical protein
MKGIIGLAAVLLGLLAWESLSASDRPIAMPPLRAPVANAVTPDAPPVAAWVDVVEARPLFARDRRPQARAAGTANASVSRDTLPRLAGTVRSKDGLVAIFAPAPASASGTGAGTGTIVAKEGGTPDAGPKPIVIGRDGIVAGWTVIAIADGAVTLERNGRTSTLDLTYANDPVARRAEAPATIVVLHEKRTNPFLQP